VDQARTLARMVGCPEEDVPGIAKALRDAWQAMLHQRVHVRGPTGIEATASLNPPLFVSGHPQIVIERALKIGTRREAG
jgi:uncharacterized protein (DUF2236 family)